MGVADGTIRRITINLDIMKSLICKVLLAATFITALNINGFSQTRSKEHDLSPFEGIVASDGFKVSITIGERYSAKLSMDDALESYVQCYVKAGVLYLELDGKGMPKELKKNLKGKNNSEPTLVAMVTMPALKTLTLNGDSQFFSSAKITATDLVINLNGSSVANNLNITGKSLVLSATKNSKFTNVNVDVEDALSVSADGRAAVAIEGQAKNISIIGGGSADINIKGEVEDIIKADVSSGSKITLTGKAPSLELTGKGTTAKVDASTLKTGKALVSVTGVSADVSPVESLELDLGRGAEVTFSGDPTVNIVKIQSASVLRKQ